MKLTFFGQFVAGENQEEIRALITRLKEFNVSVILSYAVEDDEAGGDQEKSGLMYGIIVTNNFKKIKSLKQ